MDEQRLVARKAPRWLARGAVSVAGVSRLGAAVAAAALAAAGCTGSPEPPPPPPLCPDVAIINGLERFERQATDGSGELAYYATMENIDGGCRPEGDDLLVDIRIDLVAQPGPAAPGSAIDLPYFVAVSRPGGELVDRQDFVARVPLTPGARSAGVTETFTQRFVGLAEGAADHQVLFGFALPEDEALRQRADP